MKGTKELNSKNNKENVRLNYVGAGPVSYQNGITLIALIITIIVMLILVAVTITVAVNGGLFEYAGRAGKETNEAIKAEQKLADGKIKIGEVWYDSIDAYLANRPSSQTTTIVSEAGNKILITKNYDSSTNPETLQLKAKLHVEAEDMEADKIGAQVTWVSSNEGVATVNNNGLVTALTEGTTEITAVAVYNGVTYPTQEAFVVTVTKTGLIAWVDEETLNVGDKTNIHLKLNVEGTEITTVGVADAIWTAAPDGKVTIDKTKEEITAVAGGEVEITASLTYGGKTYTDKCTVTVEELKITASVVHSDLPTYLGKTVNYGVSYKDSGDKWELFYADEKHVYIITKGSLSRGYLKETGYNGTKDFIAENGLANYPAVAAGLFDKTYDPTAAGTEADPNLKYTSSGQNMKTTQYLLDSTKWGTYANSPYADWAIGGPTFELFVKSYNAYYTDKTDVELSTPSSFGYANPLSTSGDVPAGTYLNNGYTSYWLAGPADVYQYFMISMSSDCVGSYNNNWNGLYFRPVVCLNTNVILSWDSVNEQYTLSMPTE